MNSPLVVPYEATNPTGAPLPEYWEKLPEIERQAAIALFLGQVGRNDPCVCGSGKKYKKCCMRTHEEAKNYRPPIADTKSSRKSQMAFAAMLGIVASELTKGIEP